MAWFSGERGGGPEMVEAANQEQIITAFAESIGRIASRRAEYEAGGLSEKEIGERLSEERGRFEEANQALEALEV